MSRTTEQTPAVVEPLVIEGRADYPPLDDQVEHILDNFDFGKVRKAMEAVGWMWVVFDQTKSLRRDFGDDSPEYEVPSFNRLRREAKDALQHAISGGESSMGGFRATCEDGLLKLEFVLGNFDGETAGDPEYVPLI